MAHGRPIPRPGQRRVTVTADTHEELMAIYHIRGWCHDGTECRLCKLNNAWAREHTRAIEAERTVITIVLGG